MAYTLNFVANFGPANTGLTLNAKLYDTAGVQTGATITTGFHELDDGVYQYVHTAIPDNHRGTFVMYDTVDTTLAVGIAVNPEEAERTDDILEYLQSLNLTGGSTSSPATTTGTDAGVYTLMPADIRMMTPAELMTEVQALVTEPALKSAMTSRAVLSSINEEDHRQIATITYDTTFDKDECDYAAPCSGARIIAVEAKRSCPTDDCYTSLWFEVIRNRIRLAYSFDGDGRITMSIGNRYIPDQHTIALAVETDTEGLWQLYIEGQPEIPGSGVVRICGDPWVYAYKAGVAFSSSLIDSADLFDSSVGLPLATETEDDPLEVVVINDAGETITAEPTFGAPMPDGNHTVLYAQRIANCGRLADSNVVTELAGAVVEWPLLYVNGVHKEYLIAMAVSKCYAYLINSSRSDRDVQRFATLQKHWQDEAQRLSFKLPKSVVAAARPRRVRDEFRSTFSLRAGRYTPDDGGLTRIRRVW